MTAIRWKNRSILLMLIDGLLELLFWFERFEQYKNLIQEERLASKRTA
jgi:hypothetical protein